MDSGSAGKETMAGALIRATMGATQAEARTGAGLVSDIGLRDVEDRLLCVFVLVLGLVVFLLLWTWTASFGDAQGISTTPPQPPHAAGNHSLLSVSRYSRLCQSTGHVSPALQYRQFPALGSCLPLRPLHAPPGPLCLRRTPRPLDSDALCC